MKFRSLTISLLLSAFVFVAFHDYVVGYYDSDTQIELSFSHVTEEPLCTATTVHEIIHHSMVFCENEASLMPSTAMLRLPYFMEPSQPLKTLQQNIDRPPIV